MARKSITSRPLDLIYFIYFATHIPVTLSIDFQAFIPPHAIPKSMADAFDYYLNTYKDPFMGNPKSFHWFFTFMMCEMLLQLPFFFIACIGLFKDSKYIRLPLAIYGAHVATTVLPSLVEILLNPNLELIQSERMTLCGLYAPYFILPVIMIIDSYIRVNKYLNVTVTLAKTTTTKKSAKIQ